MWHRPNGSRVGARMAEKPVAFVSACVALVEKQNILLDIKHGVQQYVYARIV